IIINQNIGWASERYLDISFEQHKSFFSSIEQYISKRAVAIIPMQGNHTASHLLPWVDLIDPAETLLLRAILISLRIDRHPAIPNLGTRRLGTRLQHLPSPARL